MWLRSLIIPCAINPLSWTPLFLTDFNFISHGKTHAFAMAAEVSHAHERTFTVCVNAQSRKDDFLNLVLQQNFYHDVYQPCCNIKREKMVKEEE